MRRTSCTATLHRDVRSGLDGLSPRGSGGRSGRRGPARVDDEPAAGRRRQEREAEPGQGVDQMTVGETDHRQAADGPVPGIGGGVRVDEDFEAYLREALGQIDQAVLVDEFKDMMDDGLENFSEYVKCRYISPLEVFQLRIGGRRLNVPQGPVKIKKGELTVSGYVRVGASE